MCVFRVTCLCFVYSQVVLKLHCDELSNQADSLLLDTTLGGI